MKYNASIFNTPENENNEMMIQYQKVEICHKIADELTDIIDSCIISKEKNEFNNGTLTKYELLIFTPEEFKKIIFEMQRNIQMGYPIVF
jgi:hypothetical protein